MFTIFNFIDYFVTTRHYIVLLNVFYSHKCRWVPDMEARTAEVREKCQRRPVSATAREVRGHGILTDHSNFHSYSF